MKNFSILKFKASLKKFFLISLSPVVILFSYIFYLSYDLPSLEALRNYVPVQTTKLISANGKPIRDLYVQKREVIDVAEVPEDLRKALVFMEDRRFFEHPGIDIWGIFRAVSVIIKGGSTQGASTLTQQLARNMYNITIGRDKTLSRKLKEAITAYNIEKTYTKSEIMELYLNSVFFGHQANGIQEASLFYFGKEARELDLNESASIIGLLPAPNTYSPKNTKRINTVFGFSENFIDSDKDESFIQNGACIDNSYDWFIDCNQDLTICENDELWESSLGNGKWDEGEKINDENIPKNCYYEKSDECIQDYDCDWINAPLKKNILTKIDGIKNGTLEITDILFIDDDDNQIPMIFSQTNQSNNSISCKYDNENMQLLVYFKSSKKIKYYRFKINGLNGMKWSSQNGGGFASDANFIESNHSWLSFSRKNLVLNVMKNQGYFQDDNSNEYLNKNLLLPVKLVKNFKRDYGLASYFTEDVRRKLLSFRQQESFQKINFILPSTKKDSILFDMKKWVSNNYKMRLNIDGYKADLYKDGLRVYCTLDTRIQNLTSDVFQKYMNENQKNLYQTYIDPKNKGLLDSVIQISKNRKIKELKKSFQMKYAKNLEQKIIKQEIEKWQIFNKTEEEIDLIISQGKHIGEKFFDCNQDLTICENDELWESSLGNGKYDLGEKFIDGNKQYNKGERFNDANGNGIYDPGEIFVDKKNKKYDPDGSIIIKLRKEINSMVRSSIDTMNYEKEFILNLLKNEKEIPDYLRKEFLIQGSVVVLDVETGNVIAMIGGRQERKYVDFFNRSSRALRQPGSVFKPFVYMTALESYDYQDKPFSANYKIQNQKFSIIDGPRDYQPENFDGKTGGEKTLRDGLKKSINLIAVRLISKIRNGPQKVKEIAENFGITSSIYPGEAIALGASSVYPLEITAAYSSIANNGVYTKPNYFYKIDNNLGSTIKELDLEDNYANPNEASVYLLRDMMRDVVRDGTAQSLRWKYKFNPPVAGKTGTTNNRTDAWFVGFTPQVCIGVWVGMDNPAVSIKKYGSEAALPIFAETIKKMYEFGEYSLGNEKSRRLDSNLDWEFPKNGIVTKDLCKESLKISNKYCKTKAGIKSEIFLETHVPNDRCNIKSHVSRFK